jgi:hypothetical protein
VIVVPQSTPPSQDPVRRNARTGPLNLPAEGRKGPAPEWPLPGALTSDESSAWAQLWATPHAAAWEKLGWVRTVARYCRVMVAAEQPDAKAALLAQATALEDRLGLTPKAMRMLLWQIVPDAVSEKRSQKAAASSATSARGRVKAVG